jgi:hypothetical protein
MLRPICTAAFIVALAETAPALEANTTLKIECANSTSEYKNPNKDYRYAYYFCDDRGNVVMLRVDHSDKGM